MCFLQVWTPLQRAAQKRLLGVQSSPADLAPVGPAHPGETLGHCERDDHQPIIMTYKYYKF